MKKSLLLINAFISLFGLIEPVAAQPETLAAANDSWSAFLALAVNETGEVDYAGLKATPAKQAGLEEYLAYLATVDLAALASDQARLATLINAYNAFAIDGVLSRYPITTVRGFLVQQFFRAREHQLAGRPISLDQLEEQIRSYDEPRIHFAIVCASRSCPRLMNTAYRPALLSEQLAQAATEFARSPIQVRLQQTDKRCQVAVNPIMKWYRDDWGTGTIAYLNQYRQEPLPADCRLSYFNYDWGLNRQAAKEL